MSFFGFDATLDRDVHKASQDEDLAVYTFGEDGYDDLAAALDEGLDELNDETFGDTGALSKDFDFAGQALPDADLPGRPSRIHEAPPTQPPLQPFQDFGHTRDSIPAPAKTASHAQRGSVGEIWSNPPSARTELDQGVSGFRTGVNHQVAPGSTSFTPFEAAPIPDHVPSRILTLEEVEAEQRAAAQLARMSLADVPRESPRLAQSMSHSPLIDHPQGYSPSPHLQQAIPTANDLDILRLAQQQHQQQQARQAFAQQHQQRQQELYDQQQQLQRGPPPGDFSQRPLPPHMQQQQQHLQQPQQSRPLSYSSPQLQQQQALPPPRFAQQPQQPPQPPLSQSELLTRMHTMDLLNGQSPIPLDQIQQIEHNIYSLPTEEREAVMNQAMNKIVEAERMEEKRRRRMHKIASMAKYNDIMTQSDKDFITRIQVSQLVTQDPYAEDFYAQVYGAIHQSRFAKGHQKVLSFGDGGGIGVAQPSERRSGRRENALNRMQTQIERIVNNSKKRESAPHANLQGALGKVSGRSYKAAPRQLLQVESTSEAREGAAKEAAKRGRDALADAAGDHAVPQSALSRRQALGIIEGLYDLVLNIEQLRREQPPAEDQIASEEWANKYNALADKLWFDSKIMAPLGISDPHPFISVLEPAKGKRVLPRLLRHLDAKRSGIFFTLFVACFRELDVYRIAPLFDQPEPTALKREAEAQFDVFLDSVIPACEMVLHRQTIHFVTSILGYLLERRDVLDIAQTPAGIALLTIILNRVTELKAIAVTDPQTLDPAELDHWALVVEHLGGFLFGHLESLFPSTRMAALLPPGALYYGSPRLDVENQDLPTWNFLAQFSINASHHQQQLIITELRVRILDNVASVTPGKGWIHDELVRAARLRNVNCLLNALGLDAAQISL